MREFYFADAMCRNEIDLKEFEAVIQLAVQTVLDDARIIVEEKRFIILDNGLADIEARMIGKLLAGTQLGSYCINRPILFVGKDQGMGFREYFLADRNNRTEVDLTEYETLITDTIHEVVPDIKVWVYPDRYMIKKDQVTSGQARKIGRLMAKTELNRYAQKRVVLFEGKEITTI